jgi:hypothetical protein
MIRWVPAKRVGLGQGVSVVAPEQNPVNENGQSVMNTIVYGGLVLAGLAFLWAITMGASTQND